MSSVCIFKEKTFNLLLIIFNKIYTISKICKQIQLSFSKNKSIVNIIITNLNKINII